MPGPHIGSYQTHWQNVNLNSLSHGNEIMNWSPLSSLVLAMAWCLEGTKPLPKPMMT